MPVLKSSNKFRNGFLDMLSLVPLNTVRLRKKLLLLRPCFSLRFLRSFREDEEA